MENFLKPYDKEYMKMAMLKHEETFKEQVYELHRLYQIQKTLMKNNIPQSQPKGQNQNRNQNQEIWNSKNGSCLNYQNDNLNQKPHRNNFNMEQPAKEYLIELDGDGGLENIEDENEIELTLAPSSYHRRRSKADDTPLNSDSALSLSSSSSGSSRVKRGARQGNNLTTHSWGPVQVPGAHPGFLSGRKNSSNMEEQMIQDRVKQQPPWLYQVLSLNMT